MLGDRWHNLRRTATVSYDGHSLASVIARVVPLCCVEHLAPKGFQSREMDFSRNGKTSHGSQEDGACPSGSLFSRRVKELDFPELLVRQPSCASALDVQLEM